MSAVTRLSPQGDPSLSTPQATFPFARDISGSSCILEPICLAQFVFSTCPHPEVSCVRHRYERLADGEGERAYGEAAWKTMKSVDPIAVVQMIEGIRGRESSFAR